MTKADICNRLIEKMEEYKPSHHMTGWADDIDPQSAERVISVMQNLVRSIRDERTKRRGRAQWINMGEKEEWYATMFKCDKCGNTNLEQSNFCPSCGARMFITEEEE